MKADPPVDEVRELRRRISARFGHDPAGLVAHYVKLQEQFRDRLIDRAKTPEPKDPTSV